MTNRQLELLLGVLKEKTAFPLSPISAVEIIEELLSYRDQEAEMRKISNTAMQKLEELRAVTAEIEKLKTVLLETEKS